MSGTQRSDLLLEIGQFIRAVDVNKTSSHSIFLGAGASISSGVKSAMDCIWEWKRQIFVSSNPGLEKLFTDSSSPAARGRMQSWLDAQGRFPKQATDDEYSFYAKEAYPIQSTRKGFFLNISKDAVPSAGYHILCLLAKERVFQKVWTTNFDHLVAKAAANYNLVPIEIGLDTTHRADRINAEDELHIYALHGDYRYDTLKNTDEELKNQDALLRQSFISSSTSSHLVVCGYSGRDESVMQAFIDAYSIAGAGRLYWCGYGNEPNEKVISLLNAARAAGRDAYYIATNGFDDLLMRLGRTCLSADNYTEAEPHFKRVDSLKNEFTPFDLRINFIDSVVKSNLLPTTLPTELFQIQSRIATEPDSWSRIRALTDGTNVVAAPLKQRIFALGTLTDVQRVFHGYIEGPITRTPIDDDELYIPNGAIKHILKGALTSALAAKLNCHYDRYNTIWGEAIEVRSIDHVNHRICKAVVIDLVADEQSVYLLLKPTIKIVREDDEDIDKAVKKDISKRIADKTYNGAFNDNFEFWRKLIFDEDVISVEFPYASGSGFTFVIQKTPLYAKIEKTLRSQKSLPDLPKYYRFAGKQFDEPKLTFSSKDGQSQIAESHPLIGLVKNRPFDFSLSVAGLSKQTNLGVICPPNYAQKFSKFLSQQLSPVTVKNPREHYAIDFPGYATAYGIQLNIPSPSAPTWQKMDADPKLSAVNNSLRIAEQIKVAINRICANGDVNVITIFIPSEWEGYRSYKTDNESFDLHDHIKAFAAQQGITTQFIEEDTVNDISQANRIHWWLSLSFYSKSMRTPWVLNNVDSSTAFAGIGYSINATENDQHVVIGCSHIYNSKGEGLRYRLAKVDKPVIKNKKPHLSYEDAYQFGISTLQLFLESTGNPLKRVVVHKRTFFTSEERRGILDGLKSIPVVDLIEINLEEDLRFINSLRKSDRLQIDRYPVARGTCIQLNSFTGLLYTHGATPSVKQGETDFMGGRGIPTPIVIKKHHGPSSLETIATEILSLTKVNWNSASLYSKLPATIQSSNEIARIGSSMLSRFSGKSYDYRLFI
jgi:hypothetical protein